MEEERSANERILQERRRIEERQKNEVGDNFRKIEEQKKKVAAQLAKRNRLEEKDETIAMKSYFGSSDKKPC